MARKKTKQQKKIAVVRRESALAYSIDEIKQATHSVSKNEVIKKDSQQKTAVVAAGFDSSYVLKDLAKTIVVTVLVVGVLVAYTIFN